MPDYYSQHGEDAIAWALFQDRTGPRYFVEVGALDGERFSNTYSFEKSGWRGVCIEPHRDYIDLLRRNRPGSCCVHAAVSNWNSDQVNFYANYHGADLKRALSGRGQAGPPLYAASTVTESWAVSQRTGRCRRVHDRARVRAGRRGWPDTGCCTRLRRSG